MQRRHPHKAAPIDGRHVSIGLAADHPAVVESRTMFPSTVRYDWPRILIPGVNNPKIGSRITKGRWKGLPIYTLTLEERATCPESCRHWRGCFGNRMHWAHRHQAGEEFEARLVYEVADLALKHPGGFAVRLHVLGDFYSVEYVKLWQMLVGCESALHVFGFTARWGDKIAAGIHTLNWRWPKRCAIRFSNAPTKRMSTVTVQLGEIPAKPAIQCPQQTGRTECCATCALCWQTTKPIAFIEH